MEGNSAYLVGVLKVEGSRLVFKGADIFSEAEPSLGDKTISFVLAEQNGDSYEDAISLLKDSILRMARYSRAYTALLAMMHKTS
jgi:hypothetical protein